MYFQVFRMEPDKLLDALGKLRQEDQEFKVTMDYIV